MCQKLQKCSEVSGNIGLFYLGPGNRMRDVGWQRSHGLEADNEVVSRDFKEVTEQQGINNGKDVKKRI